MSELRMRVVEAGARALLPTMLWNNSALGLHYVTWDEASEAQRDSARDTFAQSFEVALDCLTENADEWKQAAYEMVSATDSDEFGAAALAVLRERDEHAALSGESGDTE